jgi:plastocyanin
MRRSGRHLWAFLACALCVLGLLSAIALAAPVRRAAKNPSAQRRGSCRTKAHAPRHSRHRSRCRKPRRRSDRLITGGAPTAPASSVAPAPGAAPPASALNSAPSLSSPAPVSTSSSPPEPAEAPAAVPPSIPQVQVTAVEYHFTLSRTSVPAGNVIFDFVNHGQDEHNLNVAPPEGPLAGSYANTPANGMGQLEVQLRPGTYTLFCSLPEHEKKGMKATLTVE